MNTPRLNAELSIGSLGESYHQTAARRTAGQALARRLGDALAGIVAFLRRGSVVSELNGMSDRELMDIGLSRSDVHSVFNRDFALEYSRRAN